MRDGRERFRSVARAHGLDGTLIDALVEALDSPSALEPATVGLDERAPVALSGDPVERDEQVPLLAGRYEDLGSIGAGGMGEVRRVRDRELNRTVAMKIVHAGLSERPSALARFLDEAQATAQLQHPNIVPIYDVGLLRDGRLWFTMREIRGRTLAQVVQEVYDASSTQWRTGANGWTFRRVVSTFLLVCRAVGYAHERGVVHRDLKPNNVMVGELGEVYVLDWGLAKIMGRPDLPAEAGDLDVIRTDRSSSDEHATQMGRVVGTPAYMPPEQARGQVDRIGARSDVYALGALLYTILSGQPPYAGSPSAVLHQVRSSPPVPVSEQSAPMTLGFETMDVAAVRSGPPLPSELVAACERAMAREPEHRYQTALELAADVEAWLDGARRAEQALAVVLEAARLDEAAEARSEEAQRLAAERDARIEALGPDADEESRRAAWAVADAAEEVARAAALDRLRVDQQLNTALQIDARLPEAHAALALRYQDRHAQAELVRDVEALVRSAERIRTHAESLPEGHETRIACAAYLEGDGALTLLTDPPGAEVTLHRYVDEGRRRVAKFERDLGRTPLRAVSLPMGSYLCLLRREGCEDVRYPVEIPRQGHWGRRAARRRHADAHRAAHRGRAGSR